MLPGNIYYKGTLTLSVRIVFAHVDDTEESKTVVESKSRWFRAGTPFRSAHSWRPVVSDVFFMAVVLYHRVHDHNNSILIFF